MCVSLYTYVRTYVVMSMVLKVATYVRTYVRMEIMRTVITLMVTATMFVSVMFREHGSNQSKKSVKASCYEAPCFVAPNAGRVDSTWPLVR